MLEPWQGRGCHYSYTDRCHSYTISSLEWDVICCRIARDCVGSYDIYTSYTPPSLPSSRRSFSRYAIHLYIAKCSFPCCTLHALNTRQKTNANHNVPSLALSKGAGFFFSPPVLSWAASCSSFFAGFFSPPILVISSRGSIILTFPSSPRSTFLLQRKGFSEVLSSIRRKRKHKSERTTPTTKSRIDEMRDLHV